MENQISSTGLSFVPRFKPGCDSITIAAMIADDMPERIKLIAEAARCMIRQDPTAPYPPTARYAFDADPLPSAFKDMLSELRAYVFRASAEHGALHLGECHECPDMPGTLFNPRDGYDIAELVYGEAIAFWI